jgi:transaldolase
MKLFIDSANLDHIREVHAWGVLAGVTTNPSLIAKEGRDFIETIHEICELVKGPVSAEVIAPDAAGMIREGRLLAQVSPHVVVKVPLTPTGLAATRALSDDGIPVNVTLCFQPAQALLAALAGATYISPFVGRLDDISEDGIALIRQIAEIYAANPALKTQVLSASIRHPLHVVQSAAAGAHVATVPYDVFRKLVKHPLTDAGNAQFLKDWETVQDRDITARVTAWLARR